MIRRPLSLQLGALTISVNVENENVGTSASRAVGLKNNCRVDSQSVQSLSEVLQAGGTQGSTPLHLISHWLCEKRFPKHWDRASGTVRPYQIFILKCLRTKCGATKLGARSLSFPSYEEVWKMDFGPANGTHSSYLTRVYPSCTPEI